MTPQYTEGTDPGVDGSVWGTTVSRIGAFLNSVANEFIQCVQFVCQRTNGTQSYEKAGLIIEGIQQDPSDYSRGITKDGVALSRVMQVGKNNPAGRAWGGYDEAGVEAGSDGSIVAQEIGLNNNGSEQPQLGTPTTKVAQSVVAGEYAGNKNVTAARYVTGGTAKFFNGDIFEHDAFTSDASPVVGVQKDGTVLSSLRADGTLQLRYVVAPSQPAMQPGTLMLWGDTSTGVTYLVFFDGGNYLKTPLT